MRAMWTRGLAIAVIVAGCGRIGFDPHEIVPAECTPAVVADGVGTGLNFTCAHTLNGTLSCWGDGNEGQLGDGNNTTSVTPVTTASVRQFAIGIAHACAMNDAGLSCWGRNQSGELGLGDG